MSRHHQGFRYRPIMEVPSVSGCGELAVLPHRGRSVSVGGGVTPAILRPLFLKFA